MLGLSGRAALVSLGVFIGVVFFGVNVSLSHFNRVVQPEHPLYLVQWRVEGEKGLAVSVLGEKMYLRLPGGEIPGQLLDAVQQKTSRLPDLGEVWRTAAAGWPERIRRSGAALWRQCVDAYQQWFNH